MKKISTFPLNTINKQIINAIENMQIFQKIQDKLNE